MSGPVSVEEAIGHLRPGMRVLLPPGCAEPTPLIDELVRQASRLAPLTLVGGLLLGGYPFCAPEFEGRLRWVTFHVMPPMREALARGQAEFVSLRYFDAPWAFGPGGPWAADAVLVQTAPPDGGGRLSLGVSTSYPLPVARAAPVVIAEVNQRMPRTLGDSTIGSERVTAWIETDRPLVPYPAPTIGEVERRIAQRVADMVPDGATIQIGIGAVPEAVVSDLADHRDLGVHSFLCDAMLPLIERGVITGVRNARHPGCLDVGEIMGTEPLFRWAHESARLRMAPSTEIHDPRVLAGIRSFVSINSAVEVDLAGQVNAEAIGGRQVAGVGGQFDFVTGAALAGGRSIIALPSTGRGGAVSRIVARLGPGTPVTTPRHLVDCIVTEHGRADVRGLSEAQRVRALTALAAPAFREPLERAWRERG